MTPQEWALRRFLDSGARAQAAVDHTIAQSFYATAARGPQLRLCRVCGEPLQWGENDGHHFPDPIPPLL